MDHQDSSPPRFRNSGSNRTTTYNGSTLPTMPKSATPTSSSTTVTTHLQNIKEEEVSDDELTQVDRSSPRVLGRFRLRLRLHPTFICATPWICYTIWANQPLISPYPRPICMRKLAFSAIKVIVKKNWLCCHLYPTRVSWKLLHNLILMRLFLTRMTLVTHQG
ncbi:YOL036W-like protein [Saccharomyces kudriavzevii IFO 1802]|uniref:YOL036W-like protein n=1 Tax=Saccharomyces kudriavzevii (strain ATCC MYA-4449 / AS 2.2408 / CBS 8840 / NBRC 1802 / NCYC 2889) TaxID=226230 RepID=J6EH31_SACK1|nr:YOL036W-like protein [Saccharomyces kudriavzevii IFO 1802]